MKKFWVTDATVSGDSVVFNKIICADSVADARWMARAEVGKIAGYSGAMTFEVSEDFSVNPVSMVCRDTGCAKYIISGRKYLGKFDEDGNFCTNDGRHIALKEDNHSHPQFTGSK